MMIVFPLSLIALFIVVTLIVGHFLVRMGQRDKLFRASLRTKDYVELEQLLRVAEDKKYSKTCRETILLHLLLVSKTVDQIFVVAKHEYSSATVCGLALHMIHERSDELGATSDDFVKAYEMAKKGNHLDVAEVLLERVRQKDIRYEA